MHESGTSIIFSFFFGGGKGGPWVLVDRGGMYGGCNILQNKINKANKKKRYRTPISPVRSMKARLSPPRRGQKRREKDKELFSKKKKNVAFFFF